MNCYSKIFLGIVLFSISIISCNNQGKHPKKCIELSDEGVKYMETYQEKGEHALSKAIDLYKQAIACDSTNYVFYSNLATA